MKLKNILAAAIIGLLFSCKKSESVITTKCKMSVICGDIQCITSTTNINFRLVDKNTGNNLLFGVNPVLTINDVKLYSNSTTQFQINKYADTLSQSLQVMYASEMMNLQVKNEPLKQISIKTFCDYGCCSRTAVEIMYDGELLIADDKNIFTLKR